MIRNVVHSRHASVSHLRVSAWLKYVSIESPTQIEGLIYLTYCDVNDVLDNDALLLSILSVPTYLLSPFFCHPQSLGLLRAVDLFFLFV